MAFAKTETIPPTSGHVRGRPTFSLRLSQWQLQAAQRNPLAVDAFGIQAREINSASLRLAQYDRLSREFARFFNFAIVRQHSGGRTTGAYVHQTAILSGNRYQIVAVTRT